MSREESQQLLHQFHQEQQCLKSRMEQEVCTLQEVLQSVSQLETCVKQELEESQRRCLELEARLEEACVQLKESMASLETQEVLVPERSSMEAGLQIQARMNAELRYQQKQKHQDQLEQLRAGSQVLTHLEGVNGCRPSNQQQTVSSLRSELDTLQEVLKQEQDQASQLRSSLAQERNEVTLLDQEKRTYIRLVDQLSSQVVEMEEEISSLRNHLRDLSLQLNDTADLVLDLRRQLNSKTSELDLLRVQAANRNQNCELKQVREQVFLLQQALQDSQNQVRTQEEDFDRDKRKMAQKLMGLENLVLDLEDVMELNAPHRFVRLNQNQHLVLKLD